MRPNIGRAILGGFVATAMMTPLMYFIPLMMGTPMDIGAMLARMLGNDWMMGMLLHLVNGTIVFPLMYVFLLYRSLPGLPWIKGTIWGSILWLLAQSVVMPMMGAGFFSSAMGGLLTSLGSLLVHVIYGTTLGAVTGGPTEKQAQVPPRVLAVGPPSPLSRAVVPGSPGWRNL